MEEKHGTQNWYSNKGCRCRPCKDAHNLYMREYKRRIKKNPILPGEHGRASTYSNKGCRCADCRRAAMGGKRSIKTLRKAHARPPVGTPCECCGKVPANGGMLQFDHDHETELFRGWICVGCNTGIGKLGDNVAGLHAALEYLSRAARRRD